MLRGYDPETEEVEYEIDLPDYEPEAGMDEGSCWPVSLQEAEDLAGDELGSLDFFIEFDAE